MYELQNWISNKNLPVSWCVCIERHTSKLEGALLCMYVKWLRAYQMNGISWQADILEKQNMNRRKIEQITTEWNEFDLECSGEPLMIIFLPV